jgi:hypothetical protein
MSWVCSAFGHAYRARVDEIPREAPFTKIASIDTRQLRELLITRTYVRDVCVRCGLTIERGADACPTGDR